MQMHSGEKPFQCDICFKKLASKPSLLSHKSRHDRQMQQQLEFDKCQMDWNNQFCRGTLFNLSISV